MALIPPFFSDCVVALGVDVRQGKRASRQWVASGFLYGHLAREQAGRRTYRIFLVTNRHALDDLEAVHVRFNPRKAGPARDFDLPLLDRRGRPIWHADRGKKSDVSVIPINIGFLKRQGLQSSYFKSDEHAAPVAMMRDLGVSEGDFVYTLGYPSGFVGEGRTFVTVRSGTIARVRDLLGGYSGEYLIDAFVFPGNSGGPVVTKPEVVALPGTRAHPGSRLIGVVQGYVPYQDLAVSLQTDRPRVLFEENSGIASVHPIDRVQAAIEACVGTGR